MDIGKFPRMPEVDILLVVSDRMLRIRPMIEVAGAIAQVSRDSLH